MRNLDIFVLGTLSLLADASAVPKRGVVVGRDSNSSFTDTNKLVVICGGGGPCSLADGPSSAPAVPMNSSAPTATTQSITLASSNNSTPPTTTQSPTLASSNNSTPPATTQSPTLTSSKNFTPAATNNCGPTSVSTIPGCWGIGACAHYLAAEQGAPSGSPNWCQCGGYEVPLLTHTNNGQTSTDCKYSVMPTANVPLSTPSTPPCSTDSPSWALTQDNWVDANVDANLYAWWHGTSDTVPSGVPPAPVTTNDAAKSAFGLAQQLVSKAAGIQTFQCQEGSDLNCIAPQTNFCQYQNLPRWAYFAWVAMSELHQTMKALDTSSSKAIGQAQALATDLITDFEVDEGNSALFVGQTVFQILGTIVTIAGVIAPLPKGVGSARPLPNIEPKPPEDVSAVYGLVPGIAMSGISGVWERLQDASPNLQEKVGALEQILVALQNNVSTIIEQYNDHMFWDAAGADDLMNLLSGGFFLQPTNVSDANATAAWSTDILSRVINTVWRGYPTYVSFTDLADDSSGSKCNADTFGPKDARYCADGGVYYLNNYVSGLGGLGKPNGFDQLASHGIDPSKIVQASAAAYRAKGIIVGTPPIGAFDDVANSIVLQNIGDGSGEDLLGSLPGEWALPVCAQGTNHWVVDYETSVFDDAGNLPCACGENGKETSDFLTAANFGNGDYVFASLGTLRNACSMLLNKNTKGNPGWSGIQGGPPDTLTWPNGLTIPKGYVCRGTKCTKPG